MCSLFKGVIMSSPVKVIRERLLITQAQLAERLGISRQMVWAYETGRSMPRFDIVKKLMDMARHNNIQINAEDFFISN